MLALNRLGHINGKPYQIGPLSTPWLLHCWYAWIEPSKCCWLGRQEIWGGWKGHGQDMIAPPVPRYNLKSSASIEFFWRAITMPQPLELWICAHLWFGSCQPACLPARRQEEWWWIKTWWQPPTTHGWQVLTKSGHKERPSRMGEGCLSMTKDYSACLKHGWWLIMSSPIKRNQWPPLKSTANTASGKPKNNLFFLKWTYLA